MKLVVRNIASELESSIMGDLEMDVKRISTGCKTIDDLIGGGVPTGRITEVVGDFSTGKSLIGLQMCREISNVDGVSVYIDAENALDRSWVEQLGINPDLLILPPPEQITTLEDTYDYIRKVLKVADKHENYFLIIWDTIAATPPKGVRTGEGSMVAIDARVNSQELRTLIDPLKSTETALVIINQLRDKPNVMFGQKWESYGGRAIRFYSTMRLLLKKGRKIIKNKTVVGLNGTAELIKTRLGRPHGTAKFELLFDEGIK